MAEVPSVEVEDVPAVLKETVLLDVREDDEWARGHVDGAVHIPLGELPARLDELPTGTQVVVTCRSGGRSSRAVTWLNQNGYDAVNLEGGMGAWSAAGRPLVAGDGAPGTVR